MGCSNGEKSAERTYCVLSLGKAKSKMKKKKKRGTVCAEFCWIYYDLLNVFVTGAEQQKERWTSLHIDSIYKET